MNDPADDKGSVLGSLKRSKVDVTAELQALGERLDKQRTRFDDQRERIDAQSEKLDKQRDRIDRYARLHEKSTDQIEKQNNKLTRQQEKLDEVSKSLADVVKSDSLREVDLRRAMQQLAALEARLGLLEERLRPVDYASSDQERVEARSLIDAVRSEHEQVRVRFQVIGSYEERIRRLEASLGELYDGDSRHPL